MTYDIIIPTYMRPERLRLTLDSLVAAQRGDALGRVIVVENGPKSGADAVCSDYVHALNVDYIYSSTAGLGQARNLGSARSDADIVLFFDDDIRLNTKTLTAYEGAFAAHGAECFFGGPLEADYESPPQEYLLEFLPWSAKGYSLGDAEILVEKPAFLGGNMGIGRLLLFAHGPYDAISATGAKGGGVGEETRLQQKLLDAGIRGVYVPGALVGHYVPSDRCNFDFVARRYYRMGFGEGQLTAEKVEPLAWIICGVPGWYLKWKLREVVASLAKLLSSARRRDRVAMYILLSRIAGQLRGVRSELRARGRAPQ